MAKDIEDRKVIDNEDTESFPSEAKAKEGPMDEFLRSSPKAPAIDDVVEGPVVAIGRARVYVDLPPFGTGIIYGRESLSARETLNLVHIALRPTAKGVGPENEGGYIELSLREA